MNKKRRALILTLMVFALLLACSPCRSGESAIPGGPVQVSPEAADRLEAKLREALQNNPSGQFILHLTDEEVTSYAALKLGEAEEAPITDPQIRFTKGKVYMTGNVVGVLPFRVRATVVASAEIVDEQLQVKLDKVTLGPLPVPNSMLKRLSQTINETLSEAQLEITVSEIQILEGEILIAGAINPK